MAQTVALPSSPGGPVALIDGVALLAAQSEGASDYNPVRVSAVPVSAGALLPARTDAVLPAHAVETGLVVAPVARGTGVAGPGHDVPHGMVLAAGTLLAPLHLALLPSDPLVLRRRRVVAGTEALRALVDAAGGVASHGDAELILTGGALTNVAIDGIAMRPGEATALGFLGATPAIRLPAHPAEAATIFALLVAPALRTPALPPSEARLTRKISSGLGLLDAVRVRVGDGCATPLGPAAGIGLLAAAGANGLVLVPEGSEGYPAGAVVTIYPL